MNFKRSFFVANCLLLACSGFTQIPKNYYSGANNLQGGELKQALNQIIEGHTEFPYSSTKTDTWDIIKEADKDPYNPENVVLIYSGWSVNAAQEYNKGKGWSRETVWAKTHGDITTSPGPGTDLHQMRACDISMNNARGNLDFDYGGELYEDNDGMTSCRKDIDSWEPRDAVKGDIARILFYMAVRYEGTDGEPDLELADQVNTSEISTKDLGFHGKLSTLLKWHQSDPVDSFEIRRNNVIYSYQGNRNPFIDHPDFATSIWGTNTSAQSIVKADLLWFYPNPAKDQVNIIWGGSTATVRLLSLDGELIYSSPLLDKHTILIEQLPAGLYFIQVIAKDRIFKKKLLVESGQK